MRIVLNLPVSTCKGRRADEKAGKGSGVIDDGVELGGITTQV